MATRGQILDSVQNYLGEKAITGGGTWSRDILAAYLQEACNEHAQKCWSVRIIEYINSFYGVQEYVLPSYTGQILTVRYHDNTEGFESRDLTYDPKRYILDYSFGDSNLDDPEWYYTFQDTQAKGIGLYPIPDKPPVFKRKFEADVCQGWTPILDRSGAAPIVYGNNESLVLDEADDAGDTVVNGTGLDPCRMYISHVRLFLRREGHPPPGNFNLQVTSLEEDIYNTQYVSVDIPAASITVRPEWVLFDFSENPIEITDSSDSYSFTIRADAEYTYPVDGDTDIFDSAVWDRYNGRGILIGTETDESTDPAQTLAFFEMHRFRNDIEIEHYSNVVEIMTHDDDIPEVPGAYHHTLIKMVLEKAYMMGGHDLVLAREWGDKAAQEMLIAKGQAVIPTLGDRSFLKRTRGRSTNVQFNNSTGVFTGSFRRR